MTKYILHIILYRNRAKFVRQKIYLLLENSILSLTIVLAISLLFISCEPDPNIALPSIKKQLVVDGWIENNNYAYVILTYNTGYFSDVDSASFRGLVASRAKVTVSDGQKTEILTLVKDTNYFPPRIYRGNEIVGEVGKTYTLIVIDEIDTITNKYDTIVAQTTIKKPVELDRVWFSQTTDSSGILKGILNDNPNEDNYYRIFTKIKGENKRYIPALIPSYEDSYFNGQKFTFYVNKGPESYMKPYDDIEYSIGDSILLRVTSIEKKSYNFWITYDQEILNSGNPFAANFQTVSGNIKGGLGIWCGYGATYYYIIAK